MDETQPDEDIRMEDVKMLIESIVDTLNESLTVLNLTKRSPIYTGLNRFSKICGAIKFEDLSTYFVEIYQANREYILDEDNEDSWIEKGVMVWFGKELLDQMKKNYRLMISASYGLALQLRDKLEDKEVEGDEDEEEDDSYYFADEILCYTLRFIFFRSG